MENRKLRDASVDDLPFIRRIYEYYVRHSTCTFDGEPPGEDYWQAWLAGHDERYPALVATVDDSLVGWGCLSRWNTRCAYRFSVEDSVYVMPELHRRGIGKAILAALIESARAIGYRNIIPEY